MRYKLGIPLAIVVIAAAVAWGTRALRGSASPASSSAPVSRLAASASTPSATQDGLSPATGPALASRATAPPTECLDLIPAGTLLCWYGRPFPDTADPDAPNAVQALTQYLQMALNNEQMLCVRALEAFNIAIRYPHVFALIDASATLDESRNPPVTRGDRIRFAMVVEIHGKDDAFARIIQATVNEQTARENSSLLRQQAGEWPYAELRDDRLPDWCRIAWGKIGPFFVFTIGPDVWPSIAAVAAGQEEALSHTNWLESVRDDRARNSLIEIIVRSQDIRERLDPFVDGRATAFFSAWRAEDIERSHWAIGFEGRAMYCVADFLENGQSRQRLLADPNINDPRLMATIPDGARYAIYRIPPAETLPRFFNGLLATGTAAERRNVRRLWRKIQEERGFDADRDILAHMGEYIVMHNDPPHPFRIPLAMTTLTEIREEPEQVSRAIDALSEAWRDAQKKLQETAEGPNSMLIEREPDGIWYVDFGPVFAGPAWVVTDKFLITSWSSQALHMYLDKVGDRAGRRIAK